LSSPVALPLGKAMSRVVGRGEQFLFTCLLFTDRRTTMNSTLIPRDWSTRLHFPTVWDRHTTCLLYLKTLFCACEPQSQGGGGFWTGQSPGSLSEGPGVQGFNFRTALPLLQVPDSKIFRLIC